MADEKLRKNIAAEIKEFVTKDVTTHYGTMQQEFEQGTVWQSLREVGTQLWMDIGNINDIEKHWSQEFSAVNTNKTLPNKEIQTGQQAMEDRVKEVLDR